MRFARNPPGDGHGRDQRIFFSPIDYEVTEGRQKYADLTEPLSEKFS
jgi:hypothetical protein